MTTRNCVFTACDERYVPQAVVALTAARKWTPEFDLFLITDSLTEEGRAFLDRYGIQTVVTPLDGHFRKQWDYPRTCYFWFAGADALSPLGYDAGVYLDADTLTNGDLSGPLEETKTIGGVPVGPIKTILRSDLDKLEHQFGPISDADRIQSGVVTMNFGALQELDFFNAISQLYDMCLDIGAPRKGDDGLLALAQSVYPKLDPIQIDSAFNMIDFRVLRSGTPEWHRTGEGQIARDGVFHFTAKAAKPWNNPTIFPMYRAKYFTLKWERHAADTLTEADLRTYFPALHAKLTKDHLRFYWYPANNVGDQVTPYLVSRTNGKGGIANGISEKEIAAIEAKRNGRLRSWLDRMLARKDLPKASYIVSCGSVIRLCNDHALVFGSGIRSKNQEVRKPFVRFVRGPLTRERFLSSGVECPAVFGDPALCLPRVFAPNIKKEFDLGVIPHFTEVDYVKEHWTFSTGITLLDPRTSDVEDFLTSLLKCRRTVSSSLHGLIFSHAYRIPTRHILISDTIFGDGTKYKDHYMCVRIEHDPLDLRGVQPNSDDLKAAATELMTEFDDRWLWDEMYVDAQRMKPSAQLPY